MEKEQAIKEYKQAYAWMIKAQRSAMFAKGIMVNVEAQYCEANDRGKDSLAPFTCAIWLHIDAPDGTRDVYRAEWCEWAGIEKFHEDKKIIRAILRSKGVNI